MVSTAWVANLRSRMCGSTYARRASSGVNASGSGRRPPPALRKVRGDQREQRRPRNHCIHFGQEAFAAHHHPLRVERHPRQRPLLALPPRRARSLSSIGCRSPKSGAGLVQRFPETDTGSRCPRKCHTIVAGKSASNFSRAAGSTGLTMCDVNPASCDIRFWFSCPQPDWAMMTMSCPHGSPRIRRHVS